MQNKIASLYHSQTNLSSKQKTKLRWQSFLNTFLPENKYSTKEINGFILEKRWMIDRWNIAVFTKESFKTAKDYYKQQCPKISNKGQLTIGEVVREAQPVDHRTGSSTQRIKTVGDVGVKVADTRI